MEKFDKELIEEFLNDSMIIIEKLKKNLTGFLETKDSLSFEIYGQEIDRIMGAAYTLNFRPLGDLAKMGKEIGYKASQISDIHKLLTLHSLLSQIVKEVEKGLGRLKKGDQSVSEDGETLLLKLESANNSLGNLRTSVKL